MLQSTPSHAGRRDSSAQLSNAAGDIQSCHFPDYPICQHALKLDRSSKFSSPVPADALYRHSFQRHFVNVTCRCVGSRLSRLQSSNGPVAGSFVHLNLNVLHSGHVRVKRSRQVCMSHFPGSFRTSASSCVGESLRFAFAVPCAPHAHRDSRIAYMDEPTFLQVLDSG